MKRFVIFTAIVGGYDIINQPNVIDSEFDYVLFSNDIQEKQIGVWQIKNIPYFNNDNTRIARWVKTHPEALLPKYQASLWMDAALVINTSIVYHRFFDLFYSNTLISSMWHTDRDCAYEEAVEVVFLGLEHEKTVINWMNFLLKEHYPKHHGLFETNVVYRKHTNIQVQALDYLWWNCIDQYSRRDQLSFNYSLWKCEINCPFFFTPNENARNSAHISYSTNQIHTNRGWRLVTRSKKEDRLLFYYNKTHSDRINKEKIKSLYILASNSFSPQITIFFVGLFYKLVWLYVSVRVRTSKLIAAKLKARHRI